jgi:Zn-dependent metalloprotease
MTERTPHSCQFVPPYLLERLAEPAAHPSITADPAARAAERTLTTDASLRAERQAAKAKPATPKATATAWTVYTAGNKQTLPGTKLRSAGEPENADAAVNEAATGGQAALDLFKDVYGRASFDGKGSQVVMTVHYGRNYDNAFWNGTQLVFGDGDGTIFDRFTKPIDVLGHELSHAVTERTAGLVYSGQSGALNESMSDVFGICAKQRQLGQSADEADWLIGAGIFLPGVDARALRDMAHPGTAYDDARLGKDPQVGDVADYVETTDDNGGVHINSGIPNRAFYLAATGIGGTSAEGAGKIWYDALTGSDVGPKTDFAGFAAATIAAAGAHADVVRKAWTTVGVTPSSSTGTTKPTTPASGQVTVRRSGGFAGRTITGAVDLDSDDPRAPKVRRLVARATFTAAEPDSPQPDAFSYTFCLPEHGEITVPEDLLTKDLKRLAKLLLEDD